MSIKERIIDIDKLSRAQIEYIVSNLYCIPWGTRVTYEVLPAIAKDTYSSELYPYEPGITIPEYFERYKPLMPKDTDNIRDTRRIVIRIAGYDPEDTKKSRYDLSISQGEGPIGADILSHRLSPFFNAIVGPLALFFPHTWELDGMMGENIPGGIAGLGVSALNRIWESIGGSLVHMQADPDAISYVELFSYSLPNVDELKYLIGEAMKMIKDRWIKEAIGTEEDWNAVRKLPQEVFRAGYNGCLRTH